MTAASASPRRRRRTVVLVAPVLALVAAAAVGAVQGEGEEALAAWLARQAEIETWTAEVVQTRRLKSLVRPLVAEGRVWFVRPDRFRWQLGEPPKTIAVRTSEALTILYPRLKQAERYPFGTEIDESWRQALALLEVGFPEDPESFRERYLLDAAERLEDRWRFRLTPRATEALQLIEQVTIEASESDWRLLATELAFPDGSSMRNDFSDHRLEIEDPEELFTLEIGDDWELVLPFDRSR